MAEVQKRIDSTLATLDKTRKQISGQRDTMLSLRDRLVDPIANVNRTLKQLRTNIRERLAGIFNRDRPVLWNINLYETIREELRAGGYESVTQQVGDFKDYVHTHIPKIVFHVALFICLAIGLRLLGSRAIELAEEDYGLRRASLVFALPTAMAAAGIELTKLTIVAGGLSVGVGFGLQNIINNFVSGLILLFERPLKVGDDIQIASVKGEIRRIGIRASSVRSGDGAEVIVPNSKLISEAVTNWTFADRRRRVEISVSVKSKFDAQQVIELLLAVARAHSSVLQTPPPRAYLVQYGESSLEFVLRVWIAEFRDESTTRSDLNAALQKALAEAGIVEPLRTIDPEAAV